VSAAEHQISGIHHVTAIASDPQRNIDFYSGFLGLRLVKLTVNFDDPSSYHIYYGDRVGHPGTILTFFSWPYGPQGRPGTGLLTTTSFSVPEGSMEFWIERFRKQNVKFHGPTTRFGEQVLAFTDPDDLQLELVASQDNNGSEFWEMAPVPAEYAIRRFRGITLTESNYERTASLLTQTLGFRKTQEDEGLTRFVTGNGTTVDVLVPRDLFRGEVSVGTVHHIAWRTPDDDQQKAWREKLLKLGVNVTPIIDRKYFHSVYFREPGGVLFEIATDPPGFTVDEPAQQLGMQLQLPHWLEPRRKALEETLPRVRNPTEVWAETKPQSRQLVEGL
jgi:glyoxalase family protein